MLINSDTKRNHICLDRPPVEHAVYVLNVGQSGPYVCYFKCLAATHNLLCLYALDIKSDCSTFVNYTNGICI